MKSNVSIVTVTCLVAAMTSSALADLHLMFRVEVTEVVSGDTVTIRYVGNPRLTNSVTVKLDGVEAPAPDAHGAEQSKDYLRSLIISNAVEMWQYTDMGRMETNGVWLFVSRPADRINVNIQLLKQGWVRSTQHKRSWTPFLPNAQDALNAAQAEAQKAELGIWQKKEKDSANQAPEDTARKRASGPRLSRSPFGPEET